MWNPIGLIKWQKWVAWENSPLKPYVDLVQDTLNYMREKCPPYFGSIEYDAVYEWWGIKTKKRSFCKAHRLQ